jgi:4-amino-4-deoxy-L-arabinose transferase-like glycosyltransferase
VSSKQLSISPKTALIALSVFILMVRLITLACPDLVDTTEGRYAGVAQLMLQRDDWVTPWIYFEGTQKPYLGKPPLHFWLVQTSFLIFGENNFAARLPGVVSAVGIAATLAVAVVNLLGWEAALVAIAIFGSSCMTFFLGGSVLLDVTLTFGLSIALVGFLLADISKLAGYAVFLGLGLGVLVKGPLACVLAGVVVAPWALWQKVVNKSWPVQLSKLPWVTGAALFLATVIPWYIWAEIRNPGFLKYFLWNENFGRYLKSDYGDEYGTGHKQPFGVAWAMMLLAVFPWSFIILGLIGAKFKSFASKSTISRISEDPLLLFALCWTLSCPVLLLGARQYTATYLMPSVPGFALLVAVLWSRHRARELTSERSINNALTISTALIIVTWAVISICTFWLSPNLLISISSLALALWTGTAFFRFAKTERKAGQTLGVLILLSFITILVYGSATLGMNNHLSKNRSARRALQVAHEIKKDKSKLKIGFPYYFPFSSAFYTPLIFADGAETLFLKEGQINSADFDILIVRERNLERLSKELPNTTELASEGQWRIIERKQ